MNHVSKSAFIIFMAVAVITALFSPMASVNPDGLDWTIEKNSELKNTDDGNAAGTFLFSDYKIPFIKNETVSTIFSAFIGCFIILMFFKVFLKKNILPAKTAALEKNNLKSGHNAL